MKEAGAKSIVAAPQGEGEYSFKATGSQVEVAKKAVWDTINIHGREWRVVLVASEGPNAYYRNLEQRTAMVAS